MSRLQSGMYDDDECQVTNRAGNTCMVPKGIHPTAELGTGGVSIRAGVWPSTLTPMSGSA